MTSSQTNLRRQTLRVLCLRDARPSLAAIALLALGTSMPAMPTLASELSLGNSLEATPLVLKDGRIARLSIHTIPFPEDAAALASPTAMELETLTQTVATDCFLTAQVIGHVGKTETDGRDTVDIHRLARARADTIQQSLIVNGLPETSIASVWDWQFMVQDARATLWVFQLAAGNDCDNDMLSPPPSAKVVAMEERAPAKAAEPKPADLAGARPEAVEQRVVAAAKPPVSAVIKPLPVPVPAAQKAEQRQDHGQSPVVKPAMASAASVPAPKMPAPVQLSAMTTPAQEVDPDGRVVIADSGRLEITFATNSSYLPKGWSSELGAFLDRFDSGQRYIVRVQTSIDGDRAVAGTSSEEEAAQYNKWLADRRFERVKAWLLKNSEGSTLQIEPTDVINDGSRRVTIEVNPLG
jgi:outer membrane protein OmpA-like peptidoglycan-associated protein